MNSVAQFLSAYKDDWRARWLRRGESDDDVVRQDEFAAQTYPTPMEIDESWATLSPTFHALCYAVGTANLELPFSIAITDVTRARLRNTTAFAIASHHEGAWFWALEPHNGLEPEVIGLDEGYRAVGVVASSLGSVIDVWTRCLRQGGLRSKFSGEEVWQWARQQDPMIAAASVFWGHALECLSR